MGFKSVDATTATMPATDSGGWRRNALRIAVSVTLLAVLLWQVNLGAMLRVLVHGSPGLLLIALALMVLTIYVSACRWYLLLRGKNPLITVWGIFSLVLTSSFLGYFLPGMGTDVLRLYGLSRVTADPALVFASMLVERVGALLVLIAIVFVGLLLDPLPLPRVIGIVAGVGLFGVLMGTLVLMHPWTRDLTRLLVCADWLKPVRTRLEKLYRCLDAYRDQPGAIAWSMVVGVVFQFLRVATAAVIAAALGLEVPFLYFLVIVPTVLLLSMIPLSIGGLGVREASYVYLLGLAGVSTEAGFSFSIITFLLHLLALVPGAWIYATRGMHP